MVTRERMVTGERIVTRSLLVNVLSESEGNATLAALGIYRESKHTHTHTHTLKHTHTASRSRDDWRENVVTFRLRVWTLALGIGFRV